MGATGLLTRSRVRSHGLALVQIALVAGLGATATFVAAAAAERTSNAYSHYVERARVGDVVINPSLVSRAIDQVVRGLPGINSVSSDAFFEAFLDNGAPRRKSVLDGDPTAIQIFGSTDGRYDAMDRPAIVSGRMPTGTHEAVVNADAARDKHLHIGDVIPVSFWSRAGVLDPPTALEHSIGVERATVVGIVTLPDETLPDGVYPRQRVILSADVTDKYDCLPESPGPNATLPDAFKLLAPQNCATSYKRYSLSFRAGDRGIANALGVFAKRSDALTAALPKALRDTGAAYTLVAKTTTQTERARVDRAISPVTTALAVLTLAAAAITLAVLGLVVARELGRARAEQIAWWQLGMTTIERAAVVVVPMLAAVASGVVLAVFLAWLISPIAPVGAVRSIDPSPGRTLSAWVWIGALALVVTIVPLVVGLAHHASRRVFREPSPGSQSVVRRLLRAPNRPAVDDGIRAAYSSNRGAGLTVTLAGAAMTVVVAATVFGSSLSGLLSTPSSYGWPWDIAVMGNGGFGGLDAKLVAKSLDQRDDVRGWTELGFSNAITLDGDAVPAIFTFANAASPAVTTIEGRLPVAADEVALGSRTADDHHAAIGDRIAVAGFEVAARRATVTGIVVLPSLGPLEGDRAAPGRGVLIPEAMLKPGIAKTALSFVGIELAPTISTNAALAETRNHIDSWDPNGDLVLRYSSPVRPAEIVNARSIRTAPLLVGGLLAVAATLGLAVAIVTSVRARRRDMAVLRALGFTSRQLRASVGVQALATMLGGFVVGAPLGIVVGRLAWHAFASELGVRAGATTPAAWIAASAVGAGLVAAIAAAGPARIAARTTPAAALRAE